MGVSDNLRERIITQEAVAAEIGGIAFKNIRPYIDAFRDSDAYMKDSLKPLVIESHTRGNPEDRRGDPTTIARLIQAHFRLPTDQATLEKVASTSLEILASQIAESLNKPAIAAGKRPSRGVLI